jgi:hypothetical protein
MKNSNRKLTVLKSHLNKDNLVKTLAKKPKILVLYCHGEFTNSTNYLTEFWFEESGKGIYSPSMA